VSDKLKSTDGIESQKILSPLLVQDYVYANFLKVGSPIVDKTAFTRNLLTSHEGPYFLSRPRRFGKSFLLDTIEIIFSGKPELFAGLDIANEDHQFTWDCLPVIKLDMVRAGSDPGTLEQSLLQILLGIADDHKVTIRTETSALAMDDLIRAVSKKQIVSGNVEPNVLEQYNPRNVVILIDEYDFAILSNLNDEITIHSIQKKFHQFYATIKSNMKYIRFMFVTGIMKFKNLSFFSTFNTVKDISYNPDYSSICGFTEDEIRKYYNAYLNFTLDWMVKRDQLPQNSSVDSLMKLIVEWYDGYSWDGHTKLFNPYSIKSFLENHKFGPYWYDSGELISKELFKKDNPEMFDIFNDHIVIDNVIDNPISVSDPQGLNSTSFLLQAGYLTVDRICGSAIGNTEKYHLKIHNKEVSRAILNELSSVFLLPSGKRYDQIILNGRLIKFYKSFCSLNYKDSQMIFSAIMSGTPKQELLPYRENAFHLVLSKTLGLNIFPPFDGLASDNGWADIVIKTFQGHWVAVELEYARVHYKGGNTNPDGAIAIFQSVIDDQKSFAYSKFPDLNSNSNSNSNDNESVQPLSSIDNAYGNSDIKKKSSKINSIDDYPIVRDILMKHIEIAFDQILHKNYAKPLLELGVDVYAAAVAVYDTSDVMIRFRRVGWKDDQKDQVVLTAIPDKELPLKEP
jgi:hypothetical protein